MVKNWREKSTLRRTTKVQVVGSLPRGKEVVEGVLALGEGVVVMVKTGGLGSELPVFRIHVFIDCNY
jgi:hypothetical protein